ncbi:Crp/Fnr family transcriptional regulator [Jannaschia aquimarina]|uniref:FixK_2 protein n=1 Tax=Jannaschia aquimarina TaxID=935700 RepID=A0A0D1ECG0_9RHOB|nr:Crp/Fnr family transcriptional regulator [Jannaschia aquimarina]KIT15409.1 Nitrogen fixation regulation protein FixK [Jannaschia aquimarina]SNT22724.1 cAMP-binding domain of CRP or a regulatory subunit of cAMP-dependent protein kinases [Jannaschia aquimarina]
MSDTEVEQTQRFKVGELTVEAGTPILTEGANSAQLFTVLSGMGIRHTTLENGRRQVLTFILPGDLIGLQGAVMGEMGHSVEARTRMRLCVFDRAALWDFFKNAPARAYDLTWIAATEEHFLGEALATLGQRTAEQAVAWALVRLWQRGVALDLVENNSMPLPFRQQDLADALGLSLVHTNKTLAKFRTKQIASWRDGRLTLTDIDELSRIGLVDEQKAVRRPLL